MTLDDMPGIYELADKSPEACGEDAIEPVKPGDGPVWLLRDGKPFAIVHLAGEPCTGS